MDNREFFSTPEPNISTKLLKNDNNKLLILSSRYMHVTGYITCNISVGVGTKLSLRNYDSIDNTFFYIRGFSMKGLRNISVFYPVTENLRMIRRFPCAKIRVVIITSLRYLGHTNHLK